MKPAKKEMPYAVYGTWEVSADGTIRGKYVSPTGRESPVTIYPEQLSAGDLILTMHAEKAIDDWNYFMDAYFTACHIAGVTKVKSFQTAFE